MKCKNKIQLVIIVLGILLGACNSESANDCFQKSGAIITQEIDLPTFTKLRVNRDVSVVLQEGDTQQVLVKTGENLLNDVNLQVQNDQLIIDDYNSCNWVRDYNVTKVYITVPNLTEIVSSTQFTIQSNGVLNFESLLIVSENFSDPSVIATGEIDLELNANQLDIVGNNLTSFNFRGTTDHANFSIASGDGKVNARHLVVQNLRVYHRGSNTVTVHPVQELSAELRSTGNLIVVNQPLQVAVEEYYTGRVIFE